MERKKERNTLLVYKPMRQIQNIFTALFILKKKENPFISSSPNLSDKSKERIYRSLVGRWPIFPFIEFFAFNL